MENICSLRPVIGDGWSLHPPLLLVLWKKPALEVLSLETNLALRAFLALYAVNVAKGLLIFLVKTLVKFARMPIYLQIQA